MRYAVAYAMGSMLLNIFKYLDHQMIMNKVAFLSIGINDRGFQIGLDGFTEIYHPRFVGEISAILKQESRYSLLESQCFVRRDTSNVGEEMRVTTSGNTLADLQ
jgi:hypothetical protein